MTGENAEPCGVPTAAAPNAVERADSKPTAPGSQAAESPRDQLDRFARCVFDADDTVEIRRLSSKQSTWHRAADLPTLADVLVRQNATQNIYVGANPRLCKGDGSKAANCSGSRCGRCRLCVAVARCVFVDLDQNTLDEARFRLGESGLPAPTLVVLSGGGVHLYWRLDVPVLDLDEWSDMQSSLAAQLGGDPAVHDPPRVMRLPGFLNRKYDPPRPCVIVEADPNRLYAREESEPGYNRSVAAVRPNISAADHGSIREHARNKTLFRIAAGMRSRRCTGAGILAALLVENRERCDPPLDEAEVRTIAASAGRYPPGSVAGADDWRPFPVHVLPEPLRSSVTEGAAAIGCEPSYIALPMLATVASAIGTTRRVRIKSTWTEPAVVWAVVVGRSGTLKSPAVEYATDPLVRLQEQALKHHEHGLRRHKADRKRYDAAVRDWKERSATDRDEPPVEPCPPVRVRYVVSDPTVEALVPILVDNPRGVEVVRDELAGWLKGFDQYRAKGKGSDVPNWLQMHRAGMVVVDRKSGDHGPLFVPRAAVSVTGGIQPETLRNALGWEHFKDGLAARMLFAFPPVRPRRWSDAEVSGKTLQRYHDVIAGLLALSHQADDDGKPVPIDLLFAPDARAAFIEFYNEHADREAEALSDDVAAAYSKLEAYAARFALLFHCVRCVNRPRSHTAAIGLDDVRAAIELTRWFREETERVYAALGCTSSRDGDVSLVDSIRSRGGTITVRNLMRGPRRFRGTADEVHARLERLVGEGLGTWIDGAPGMQGGRPSQVFRLFDGPGGDKTGDSSRSSWVSSPSPPSPDFEPPEPAVDKLS